jgi:transcriptional regulator with XRE-family HTH domain
MKAVSIKNRINEIAEGEPSNWLAKAKARIEGREWKLKSSMIALRIMSEIKKRRISQEMSQKMLAEKMGVSPQYINKILKGQENLSLETICKIEKALEINLIEILLEETKAKPVEAVNDPATVYDLHFWNESIHTILEFHRNFKFYPSLQFNLLIDFQDVRNSQLKALFQKVSKTHSYHYDQKDMNKPSEFEMNDTENIIG